MTTRLLLDPDIRDWVVLPLFVIMVAAGLLRHSLGVLLLQGKPEKAVHARSVSVLRQCSKIRSGASHYFLTTKRWHGRKEHAIQLLRQEADWAEHQQQQQQQQQDNNNNNNNTDDPFANMNPMNMMMKGNMAFMVQNMIMMQGIQHFFSGFILLQVPFPLTIGFKSMFQRGLAVEELEPSYVSSVSWYFLVMYGLRSFLQLIIGEPVLEIREQQSSSKIMQYGFQSPSNAASRSDIIQQLRQEAEHLEVILQPQTSEFDTVEKRILGHNRYPQKKIMSGPDSHDRLFVVAAASKEKKRK